MFVLYIQMKYGHTLLYQLTVHLFENNKLQDIFVIVSHMVIS